MTEGGNDDGIIYAIWNGSCVDGTCDYIFSCRTEESGIEWYKSKDRVLKQSETDLYGEQGKEIHIYARCCLTSDVEHKQSK